MTGAFSELGSLADFVNGAAFTPDDWSENGKRIIRIQNLTDATKAFNRTTREVSARLHVHPGDLLVSWSASLGVFEWPGPDVAVLNQHIFRVLPNERKVDKRYLRHGLERALREMRQYLHGATMQHVNRSEFLSTKLFMPSLSEQRRIAEILDKANALRAKRRAVLAQLDTLTQSIFLDMFGEPARRSWPRVQLGSLCDRVIDCAHATPQYASRDTGFFCVRSSDIQNGALTLDQAKQLEESEFRKRVVRGVPEVGDVIYCREGARFGNTARITQPVSVCLGQRMMLFRPKKSVAVTEYLWAFLHSADAYRQATGNVGGSASPHVNIRDIVAFEVVMPPLHVQAHFARAVRQIDEVRSSAAAALKDVDALFASLQHRAFRGEL